MTTTQWFTSRKQAGKKSWTDVLAFKEGDLLEFELPFEDAGVRTVSLVGGRVLSVSAATKDGVSMAVSFIGSNDQEIVEQFSPGSEINIHLCLMTARQTECKVTTSGVLHSEKFRRVGRDDFRALSYMPRQVLSEHVPAPASSKALSLSAALSKKGGEAQPRTPAPPLKRFKGEIGVDVSPDHLFKNLADIAQGMRQPAALKKSKRESKGLLLDDDESQEDEEEDDGFRLSTKADATEIHRLQPGKLGFEMVWGITTKQLAEEGFKPCVRTHSLSLVKAMGADQQKHKAACRELVTLGRIIDHNVNQLITAEKKGITADFSRSNFMCETWKALDVVGQRWQALEYVLATQAERPDLPASKIWESLKTFELEPPLSGAIISTKLLAHSVAGASRENKLFEKIKGDKGKA